MYNINVCMLVLPFKTFNRYSKIYEHNRTHQHTPYYGTKCGAHVG